MRTVIRRVGLSVGAALMVVTGLGAAPATAVTTPPEVTAALQGFDQDPQAAMTTWLGWASTQPMHVVTVWTDWAKNDCIIDAADVTRCVHYEQTYTNKGKPKGLKRVDAIYTLSDGTQVFKLRGKWVSNRLGADTNPLTNWKRYYPYNYWLPWTGKNVPVTAATDADGWHAVTARNLKPGDDQAEVTVVRVSPDGLQAQFIQQSKKGEVAVTTTVTLTDIAPISVPKSVR